MLATFCTLRRCPVLASPLVVSLLFRGEFMFAQPSPGTVSDLASEQAHVDCSPIVAATAGTVEFYRDFANEGYCFGGVLSVMMLAAQEVHPSTSMPIGQVHACFAPGSVDTHRARRNRDVTRCDDLNHAFVLYF